MRATIALIFAPLLLSGCIYAGGRTVRDVGPSITFESTAFIEPGKTSADWLIATFGEPQRRASTADGAELLRYDRDVRTTEGSYILMLFATSSNTIQRRSWWFEVRDQKIVRFWCDTAGPAQAEQLSREARSRAPENAPAPATEASADDR